VYNLTAAIVGTLKVRINGVLWPVSQIGPIFKALKATLHSGGANYNVYLHLPFKHQGFDDGAGNAITTFTNIDDQYSTEYENFVAQSIAKFIKGRTYLIKASEIAPTKIMPDFKTLVLTKPGADSLVYGFEYYVYLSTGDDDILNDSTVDVIMFDVNYDAIRANAAKQANEKSLEAAVFSQNAK